MRFDIKTAINELELGTSLCVLTTIEHILVYYSFLRTQS